jgi:TPR repeat protein
MQTLARTLHGALMATLVVVGTAVAGPLKDGLSATQADAFATALRLLQPLAEGGDAVARTGIGLIYRERRGVPQNYAEMPTRSAGNRAANRSPV